MLIGTRTRVNAVAYFDRVHTDISGFTGRIESPGGKRRRSRYFAGATRSRGQRPRLQLINDYGLRASAESGEGAESDGAWV
jgi:hypothetical protein